MEYSCEEREGVAVVGLVGSLDAVVAEDAIAYLSGRIQAGQSRLVLDLGRLEYISSAGLRVFLTSLKEARAKEGDVRLAAAGRKVSKVLEMAGFTSVIQLYPDVDAAVASYSAS